MAVTDRVADLVEPLLSPLGIELVDVGFGGGVLKVVVDRAERSSDHDGIDLQQLEQATRVISRALDADDPVPGRYTLEVTSPGLERPLRTPAHFARAVGKRISVKLAPHVEGERRLVGTLARADAGSVDLELDDGTVRTIPLDDVTRARTVFDWGPPPKPGKGKKTRRDPDQSRSVAR